MLNDRFWVFLHITVNPAHHYIDKGNGIKTRDKIFIACGDIIDRKRIGDFIDNMF